VQPFKKRGKNYLVILGEPFLKGIDLTIKAGQKEVTLRRPGG
jgi:hypothetical protein